jgi:hypothetical protein
MISLEELLEDIRKKEEEKWNNMTPTEKIDSYRSNGLYFKYCDMTIEELEKEKEFQKATADRLRNSMFHDIYYSAYGCDENVRRINTILKLKYEEKEMEKRN